MLVSIQRSPAGLDALRRTERTYHALDHSPEQHEPIPPEGYYLNRWGCPTMRLIIPSSNALNAVASIAAWLHSTKEIRGYRVDRGPEYPSSTQCTLHTQLPPHIRPLHSSFVDLVPSTSTRETRSAGATKDTPGCAVYYGKYDSR